jgi:ABC-2 type transport system permease protein
MNIALTPWEFESRVQRGTLSPMLLLPVHPFHRDLAGFLGFKVVTFTLWLPIGALLWWLFKPPLHPSPADVILFTVSVTTAFVMRFVVVWALGLVTFWITRVSALFDLYFAIELIFSGRLVPLDVLPGWMRDVAWLLPFQWSFGFPIEVLLGRLSPGDIVLGFGAQYLWFVIGLGAVHALWRSGVRRYSAVGA